MNKLWWVAAFIVVGILLGAGILILVTRPPRGSPITLLPAPTVAPITVYVSGKVNQEGLYSLPVGSRMNDAIQAAGGFSEDANSSGLNLAQILIDGEQINVPALVSPAATGSPSKPEVPSGVLVDINTASLEQLDSLPNVGPCVLKSHRLLAGGSPVLVTVRRPGSRQPVHLGDWVFRNVVTS